MAGEWRAAGTEECALIKKISSIAAGGMICLLSGSYFALAQQPPAEGGRPKKPPMTFFVTSVGMQGGANLHGLAGADAHCMDLARAATGDRTYIWHAYLSTQERSGQPAINARDRIGAGPWYNAAGVMIAKDVDDLHSDHNNVTPATVLNELGQQGTGTNWPGDPRDQSWAFMQSHPESTRHEIITGSQPDGRAFPPGRDHTCNNYTSEEEGNLPLGRARANTGPGVEIGQPEPAGRWNSQGISGGCSHEALARSHGAGLFYCFATGSMNRTGG
jgi:hypothetical protein